MSSITFRCPATAEYVQQWIDEDRPTERDAFAVVKCPSCGRVHFVNRCTHKLLGHEKE